MEKIGKLTLRLRAFGMMPIYKPVTPASVVYGVQMAEIETVRMEIKPVPYGAYRAIKASEVEEKLKEKKEEIAKDMAKAILDSQLCQVIVKTAEDFEGPFGGNALPADQATIAIKMFIVPWETVRMYREGVMSLCAMGKQNTVDYAQIYDGMTDEQRLAWLKGNWEGF